ncbi:MAG: hypothetical protein KDA96_09220 [Planctomycetaceae bacterium]|nr:hypothetical protein [Planctomycetaceae bacterium]
MTAASDQPTPDSSPDSKGETESAQQLRIAFWNLQNLFDIETSPIAAELDYTAVNGWDRRAFDHKVSALVPVIQGLFDGQGPDLLGLCEVENERVIRRLLQDIGRDDYQWLQVEHPDITGLDTALIYSDRIFEADVIRSRYHLIDQRFPTGDILEVPLRVRATGAELLVFVNHWPSRRSGTKETEPFRIAVASHLARLVNDHLRMSRRDYLDLSSTDVALFELNERWNRNVLVMGDFNDEPWDDSVRNRLSAAFSSQFLNESPGFVREKLPSYRAYSERRAWLFNPMWSLLTTPDVGTVRSLENPRRMLLTDQFLLSKGLFAGLQGLTMKESDDDRFPVRIARPAELRREDGSPRGFQLDSQTGASDHFPITLTLTTTGASENAANKQAEDFAIGNSRDS